MRLEYEITRKALVEAELHSLKKVKSNFVFFFMLMWSLVFSALFILELTSSRVDELPLVVFGLLAVVSFAVGVQFNNRVLVKRTISKRLKSGAIDRQYFGHHRLELDDLSIKMQYGSVKNELLYAGIRKIEEYPDGIMLFISQISADIIPYSAFGSTEERIAFLNNLQSRIATAKNVEIAQESIDEQTQQAIYSFEYSWSEETFTDAAQKANRLVFMTRLGWTNGQILGTVFGLFLLFISIMSIIRSFTDIEQQFSSYTFFFLFIGIALQINPLFSLIPPLTRKIIATRIANGAIPNDYFGTQMLFIKQDRLTEVRRLTSYDMMFSMIYCVKKDDSNLYFFLKSKQFIIVPFSAFQTPEQVQEVVQFVESKMRR